MANRLITINLFRNFMSLSKYFQVKFNINSLLIEISHTFPISQNISLSSYENAAVAFRRQQQHPDKIQDWHIETNISKSIHVTLTIEKDTNPPVMLNDYPLSQNDEAFVSIDA